MIRALDSYGVEGRQVARLAGVGEEVFSDPDARVPSDTFDLFAAMAAEASGDPAFGLRFAQEHASASYHLYFVVAASDTLLHAFQRIVRFQRMVSDRFQAEVLPSSPEEEHLAYRVPEPERGRWIPTDTMGAVLVLGARGLTLNAELTPRRVEMRRPRPEEPQPYEELLRCPISFGSERNVVVWSADDVRRPLPLANRAIAAQTEGVVVRYLAKLGLESVADRLRKLVTNHLPDGLPAREALAKEMGLSPANLSRALSAESTSYRVIVNEVREALAHDYLREGATVTETAFMLGFSETSAFTRAFRRWTGHAPTAKGASMGG